MNTERLAQAGDKLDQTWQQVASRLHTLSDPARQRRIRQGLYVLAALWMVFGLANLVWSLVPPPAPAPQPTNVLNPLVEPGSQGERSNVNIDQLAGWNLFGTAASKPAVALPEVEEATSAGDLDGIENNAKETRLALKLTGILASPDPKVARAIIEAKKEQDQYAVGDELPIDKVKVAKILHDRVVLDNKGRYELLMLFDENGLSAIRTGGSTESRADASVQAARAAKPTQRQAAPSRVDQRGNNQVTAVAENYRRRLYSNPQSLAQVVSITPVREGTELTGYRVRAGRDAEQFKALGFEANDIVTGVNGIRLSDPGKAMELYRVMRTASEASFDVLRNGTEVTLVVGLDGVSAGDSSDQRR